MKKLSEQQLIIVAYQLCTFLGLGAAGYKSRTKTLGILRSQVSKLTEALLCKAEGAGLAVLHDLVTAVAQQIVRTYPAAKPVVIALRTESTAAFNMSSPEGLWRELATLLTSTSKAVNDACNIPTTVDGSADPSVAINRRSTSPSAARVQKFKEHGKKLSVVSSVASNSLWVTTLTVLVNAGAKWSAADVSIIQDELYKRSSSRQGRLQLDAKLELLWPGSKKIVWSIDDAMVVQVSLDQVALYQHPDIQKLLAHPLADFDGKVPMGQVMGTLSAQVPADSDPSKVAKQLMASIVSLAKKRLRNLDTEKRTRAVVATQRAEQQLVEQLRTLSPELRTALKKNPDLLKQV